MVVGSSRIIRDIRKENAPYERFHRNDDEEFYIPRALNIKSEADWLEEALGYIYYYHKIREHSSLGYRTPYQHLKEQLLEVDSDIRLVIPIRLNKVGVEMSSS